MSERRSNGGERTRVQDAIDEATLKAARAAAWRVGAIVFFALLSLIVGATVWQHGVNARLDHALAEVRETNDRLDRAELRACERLQNQRERANVSEARQYLLLRAVSTSPRASKKVKDRYRILSNTTHYDPPTDCRDAVARPNTYRRPPSVPFHALPSSYVEAVVQAAKDRRPQPLPDR